MVQKKDYLRGQPIYLCVLSVVEVEIELVVQALRKNVNKLLKRQEERINTGADFDHSHVL